MSLRRTIAVTLISIRYRLFRSLITVGVIMVAVAFLMNILSEGVIKRAVLDRTSALVMEYRMPVLLTARYSLPDSLEESIRNLAMGIKDRNTVEYAAFASIPEKEMEGLSATAVISSRLLDYFNDLEYSRKHRLVRETEGIAVFDLLQDSNEWDRFISALSAMRSPGLPVTPGEFRLFLDQWPGFKSRLIGIQEGHKKAIMSLRGYTAEKPVMELLYSGDQGFRKALADSGFMLDDETADKTGIRAGQILKSVFLEASILRLDVRQAVAAHLDLGPNDVNADTLWKLLRSADGAKWYLGTLGKIGLNSRGISMDDIPALLANKDLEILSRKIEKMAGGESSGGVLGIPGLEGMGERMSWLILVSLLLCVVGISNAMLMSVTERFREIAVLKCLGALDGFIMLMFILESCILGFFGGAAGALLGFVIAALRMSMPLGAMVFSSLPVSQILIMALVSTMMGVILSAIASIYPSSRAARLAPMEAMRVE